MATLEGRTRSALLVIDVQEGVVDGAYGRDDVVATIASLVARARSEGVPVVWVQHQSEGLVAGSDPWQIVAELAPADDEPVVAKEYPDAFEATELGAVLAEREVARLVVTGAQTDECIRSTLHGAIARGYDVTLVGDAHTTEDLSPYDAPTPDKVIAHTNLYWAGHRAPGRTAEVVAASDVGFGAPSVE